MLSGVSKERIPIRGGCFAFKVGDRGEFIVKNDVKLRADITSAEVQNESN